jgi:release factor glutamine methyltransferase
MKSVNIKTLLGFQSALLLNNSLEVELLLAYVLGRTRTYLHTWPETCIEESQIQKFNQFIQRRLSGEPLAYILGHKEFWSLELGVSKNVLIPRPETELLVETILNLFATNNGMLRILDLGTGSGAIALAIAHERPNWEIIAIDESPKALQVAIENAKNLSVNNVSFFTSDWFSMFKQMSFEQPLFDVIVSNPPYIAPNDAHLEEKSLTFEPRTALVSESKGLQDLTQIIIEAPQHLVSKGWLLLEHGFDQGEQIQQLFQTNHYQNVQTFKDLADLDRITIGSKP